MGYIYSDDCFKNNYQVIKCAARVNAHTVITLALTILLQSKTTSIDNSWRCSDNKSKENLTAP